MVNVHVIRPLPSPFIAVPVGSWAPPTNWTHSWLQSTREMGRRRRFIKAWNATTVLADDQQILCRPGVPNPSCPGRGANWTLPRWHSVSPPAGTGTVRHRRRARENHADFYGNIRHTTAVYHSRAGARPRRHVAAGGCGPHAAMFGGRGRRRRGCPYDGLGHRYRCDQDFSGSRR